MTIDKSLRLGSSRHTSFSIEFRHDVYRFLWGDNTYKTLILHILARDGTNITNTMMKKDYTTMAPE